MPVHSCSVPRCISDSRKRRKLEKYPWMEAISFYRFPGRKKDPANRRLWLRMMRPDKWEPSQYSRVCSKHFVGGRPIGENPAPTLFERNNFGHPLHPKPQNVLQLSKKRAWEENCQADCAALHEHAPTCTQPKCDTPEMYSYIVGKTDVSLIRPPVVKILDTRITKPPHEFHSYCCSGIPVFQSAGVPEMKTVAVQTDISAVNCHIEVGKKKTSPKQTIRNQVMDMLTKTDTSVRQYTCVPSLSILMGLFHISSSYCGKLKYWKGPNSAKPMEYEGFCTQQKPGPKRMLTSFQEMVLTLMKMRLNLPFQVLADLFGISATLAKTTFTTWANFLNTALSPLLVWPSRANINAFMPPSMKIKFPRTRVIIDCTEMLVQRPKSSSTAQHQVYSTNKSHTTFKALLGISPSGAFTFVFNFWGGNTSDRFITQHCGILDLLEKGDDVMADRGFNIRDLLLQKGATLNLLPFTRKCHAGKGRRLTADEIRKTRSISKERVHVERGIERLKDFKILSHVMPLSLKPLANQILRVCAILTNFYPPLNRR